MSESSPAEDAEREAAAADALRRARDELARQLEDACAATLGGQGETTGQLRRLDDALLAAARTTEGIIALRERAHADRTTAATPTAEAVSAPVERIREFRDRNSCRWRAWAVIPGQASTTSTRNLGELRNGWLAFESLSDSGKRRLVDFPADWMLFADGELEALLERATEAPVRKRAAEPDSTPSA